jgi:DNA anti-recombination protein RmuC
MKSQKNALFAIVLIGMVGFTPLCYGENSEEKTTAEEVRKETEDLLQTLNAYAADQRDEAVDRTKAGLDDLDRRIDALEREVDESWDTMDKAAREKARAALKELHRQRTEVAEWYGGLKNSTGEAWDHMKKGFSDAYQDLSDAWEKSEKEFGPDAPSTP